MIRRRSPTPIQQTASRAGKARDIGPYSHPNTLAKLDGRTREAALMRRVRSELTEHVGGNPSPVQRALIERAVILSLKVAQIDAKIIAGEAFALHDHNYALAWNNGLRRTLVALGVQSTSPRAPSLADLFPGRAA